MRLAQRRARRYAPIMGVAQKIAELAALLPPSKQAEVLDFVEFLAARAAAEGAEVAVWSDSAFKAVAIRGLLSDDVDDPITYELSDCKETR